MNIKKYIPLGTIVAIALAGQLLATAQVSTAVPAQQPKKQEKPVSLYRLDFLLKELEEGKVVNTRAYSMWVEVGSAGEISAGNQVPYPRFMNNMQTVEYRSVGFSLHVRLDETEGLPVIHASARVSKVVSPESGKQVKPDNPLLAPPVLQSMSMDAVALLQPGEPTTISRVDDPLSRRSLELEVTATKLK